MKKSKLTFVLLMIFLTAASGFGQIYDTRPVDISSGLSNMETSIGFSLDLRHEGSGEFAGRAAFALLYRQFFGHLTNNLEMGVSVMGTFSFLGDMNWTVPKGASIVTPDRVYNPGSVVTINSSDSTYINNTSLLASLSFRHTLSPGFGIIVDAGLAFNIDFAKWENRFRYTNTHPMNNFGVLIHEVDYVTSYIDFSTVNFGIGVNGGVQYRFGQSAQILLEAGINLSYYFLRYSTFETGWYKNNNRNDTYNVNSGSGDSEGFSSLKLGLPYIMIGLSF